MTIVSITPEIALDGFPVYAGGLGVLEGDKFYSAARMGWRYVVLTPFYPKGYVEYEIRDNGFIPHPQTAPTEIFHQEEEIVFPSNILRQNVKVRPYVYRYGDASVVFLHLVEPEQAAKAVERLYVYESPEQRSLAAILFAKGASTYIRDRIGLEEVEKIDLQESFGAVILYLLPELRVKTRYIVHTVAPWANFAISTDMLRRELNIDFESGEISLYYLAMEESSKVYAVSEKHEKLVKLHSQSYSGKITHVTNGVNIERWIHPKISEELGSSEEISLERLRRGRRHVRGLLEALLRNYKQGLRLDENVLVAGWPRRITRYKRPYFVEQLITDVAEEANVVFVLAGKAHPFDQDGQHFMKRFLQLHRERRNVVYIHDHDVEKAKIILAGVDLLLFTPFSGWEACGTSYMKAGVNGVPTLSSRDGGALEVIRDGSNGWLFGHDLDQVINIYSDHQRVAEIDEAEYVDMRRKFLEIYRLYSDKPEFFREVQVNALKTMLELCDIKRKLREYHSF